MDKKDFENRIKLGCNFGFKGKEKKECQKTMMCNWNKCHQELEMFHASMLTDEDRKNCKNKDWKKQFACQERITKKRGNLDKLANASHCEVNKCPEIRELNKTKLKNIMASIKSKKSKKSEWTDVMACRNQHCSKEEQELNKLQEAHQNEQYNCFGKFKTWKEQKKCLDPFSKKIKKTQKLYTKCSNKHCKAQMVALLKKI